MMLLDSNIIIYGAKADYPQVRQFIATHDSAVSALKVLGFHQLTTEDRQ